MKRTFIQHYPAVDGTPYTEKEFVLSDEDLEPIQAYLSSLAIGNARRYPKLQATTIDIHVCIREYHAVELRTQPEGGGE